MTETSRERAVGTASAYLEAPTVLSATAVSLMAQELVSLNTEAHLLRQKLLEVQKTIALAMGVIDGIMVKP